MKEVGNSMSNDNQQSQPTTATTEENVNITNQIQSIQKQLHEIDATEGAKVQQMLNFAAAAHASPGGDDVKVEGKTEAEWMEEFQKASKAVGEKKAELENQLTTLMQQAGRTESPQERRKKWEETVERANKAAQEPVKDLSKFSNEELDKIRSQLQNAPLKGQEKTAVDDGTGGGQEAGATTEARKPKAQ